MTTIIIILFIILSIILLCLYNNKKKYLEKKYKDEYYLIINQELQNRKRDADAELEEYRRDITQKFDQWAAAQKEERNRIDKSLIERKKAVQETIDQLDLRRLEAKKAHDQAVNDGKEKIDAELEGYHQLRSEQLKVAIACEFALKQEEMKQKHIEQMKLLDEQRLVAKQELDGILVKLEENRLKQAALNEEILRRREVEEKLDFYRVVLNPNAPNDIEILLNIREKLIFRENLDKLIYDVYISKPVMEMVKRILQGRAPSGIYKITRLKTGEIYIGKSTDIKKRWTEHCKTAFGVGTIAHSVLHTTIKKDGIENFTFELLEEVPKDKLTEREKFWINFYDSKNYGMNMREG